MPKLAAGERHAKLLRDRAVERRHHHAGPRSPRRARRRRRGAEVAQALVRVLGAAGFDVEIAVDGRQAVEAVKGRAFDVIVSDIHMPGMSGVALLRAVRAQDLDVPVILMTGEPSLETAMEASLARRAAVLHQADEQPRGRQGRGARVEAAPADQDASGTRSSSSGRTPPRQATARGSRPGSTGRSRPCGWPSSRSSTRTPTRCSATRR